jgi:hypothetical protein
MKKIASVVWVLALQASTLAHAATLESYYPFEQARFTWDGTQFLVYGREADADFSTDSSDLTEPATIPNFLDTNGVLTVPGDGTYLTREGFDTDRNYTVSIWFKRDSTTPLGGSGGWFLRLVSSPGTRRSSPAARADVRVRHGVSTWAEVPQVEVRSQVGPRVLLRAADGAAGGHARREPTMPWCRHGVSTVSSTRRHAL